MKSSNQSVFEKFQNLSIVPQILLNSPVGSNFKYYWPKVFGLFSSSSTVQLKTAIKENETWNISKKLDGSNMAVSSAGYVASRNSILANLAQTNKLESIKFQGALTLQNVKPLFQKIYNLVDLLNTTCHLNLDMEEDEIILYGEFMHQGTASTRLDIYDYSKSKHLPGHFFAFGLGFVFKQQNSLIKERVKMLNEHFSNVMVMTNPSFEKEYYICPINLDNKYLFDACNIATVDFLKSEKFNSLLANENYIQDLLNRQVEGFVLHDHTGKMFKWKYQVEPSNFLSNYLGHLKGTFKEEEEKKVVSTLEQIYTISKFYINDVEQTKLETEIVKFIEKYQKEIERDLAISSLKRHWEQNDDWDLKSYIQCMTRCATADMLFHLSLESKKFIFDKKVELIYSKIIAQKFEKEILDRHEKIENLTTKEKLNLASDEEESWMKMYAVTMMNCN